MKDAKKIHNIGVCIKDLEKRIVYQNDTCVAACGNLANQICEKGCMEHYQIDSENPAFTEGVQLKQNVKSDEGLTDVVVINDGAQIFSFLYHKQKKIDQQLESLKMYDFTKTELAILRLVLFEYTNKEIADGLFVSLATIKTHLNNIYKKLPHEVKTKVFRNRS